MSGEQLRHLADEQAIAALDALLAVETAVAEGRLNAAKVLRARALACQRRAVLLARASRGAIDVAAVIEAAAQSNLATEQAIETSRAGATLARAARDSLDAERAILESTASAMRSARDVNETDVAQLLWACDECGFVVETTRPEICPCCGAIAGEFALFAPFFASTPEHTGRLAPVEIIAALADAPAEMRAAIAGARDDALSRCPADGEWSAKEIAGHMVDIAELAERRLALAFNAGAAEARERSPLPWKLLDFEDYPARDAAAIAARFDDACKALHTRFAALMPGQWRTRVDLVSGRTLAVDVGSWVANHNTAHLEQIRARLNA